MYIIKPAKNKNKKKFKKISIKNKTEQGQLYEKTFPN